MTLQPPSRPSSAPSTLRSVVVDASILGGAGLMTYGVWLLSAPVSFIVAGVLLFVAGLNGARR